MLTYIIIGITALISVLAFYNREIFDRLKFNAVDAKESKNSYRFLTYGLIHGDFLHLFVNMLVLYSFGRIVETFYGIYFPEKSGFYFVLLYIGGLILSIVPSFGKHKNDVFYNAVGASGAVSAILFASIILYPTGKIMLLFIPIPIPTPVFGVLYIAYEYYMSKRGGDNIGHDAHLWGAIFGMVFTIALKPELVSIFLQQIF
jgi:membrane associated rhomboid family serine protease